MNRSSTHDETIRDAVNDRMFAYNYENPYTGRAEKGRPRVMHGTEAQYSGGLTQRSGESVLVFRGPDQVEEITCPDRDAACAALQALLPPATPTNEGRGGDVIPFPGAAGAGGRGEGGGTGGSGGGNGGEGDKT